jgi:Ca-activated chloride channel family protein
MNNQRHDEISHEALCAYVLGEVSADEAARIEQALESSEGLRAQRDTLAATIGLVQSSCQQEPGLAPELVSRLERAAEPAPRPNPWYLARPVRMAAGLTALAAGVLAGRALMDPTSAPVAVRSDQLALLERLPEASRVEDKSASSDSAETESSWELAEEDAESAPSEQAALASHLDSVEAESAVKKQELILADREVATSSGEPAPVESRAGLVAVVDSAQQKPSDTATTTGGEKLFLGRDKAKDGAEAKRVVERSRRSGEVPPPPRGGGGGGHYVGPGPSGPSSPGPSSPGPAGKAGRPRLSLRNEPNETPSTRVQVPTVTLESVTLQPEALDSLRDLGYVGFDDTRQLDADSSDYYLGGGPGALTPGRVDQLCRQRVEVILQSCRRRPNERPRDMFFRYWGDNPFELARLDAQSTFSVDVDTASYALVRRYLTDGLLPEKAQVRTEEFLNYFKPDVSAPQEETFAVHTDLTPSRFGASPDAETQRYMMRVVVRGREVAALERGPLALTFVVDVSGSMREGGRLELVKHSLRLLAAQLDGNDSISIVAFSNEARVVLPMTSAANRGLIEAAVYGLQPDGGTNAEAGLRLGYEMAATALTSGVQNRVVLLSDGVANIGQTDHDRINADVKARRDSGIYLNTIGVGMNNHNDTFLEQLADKGDGLCNYVDSAVEARRALVENFTGAFEPIARDVKIQVEFDPSQVLRYRLLGYENRAIADADFRNDAVDAGEVGAGHQVVALYELELSGNASEAPLAEVRLRWKAPTGAGRDPQEDSATERSFTVSDSALTSFESASDGYKRSVFVAQFAEILRRSVHARGDSLDELLAEATRLAPQLGDPDFDEFVAMMQKSRALILQHAPRHDTLTTCIDSLRRNEILRAQYDELRQSQSQEVLAELERQNRELEARIEELIRGELEAKLK